MDEHGSGPEGVGLRFLLTGYRLRRVVDDQMSIGGLSLARTKVLQVLHQRGPQRQASLAAELGMAARSITQALEAMERDGLVTRRADPGDGRAKLVELTADGASALAAGTAAGEEALRQIFDGLDQDQLADLDSVLGVIDAGVAESWRIARSIGSR